VSARTSEARTPRSNRLPGNDELFRPTSPGEDRTAVGELAALTPGIRSVGGVGADSPVEPSVERRPSGRERHDEKITVYVSGDELLELEQARLTLKRDHALKVDRGRIVRAALVEVLADLERLGPDAPLVARLREA
jgi:hypothetical protein